MSADPLLFAGISAQSIPSSSDRLGLEDYTLPLTSVLDAFHAKTLLQEVFGRDPR